MATLTSQDFLVQQPDSASRGRRSDAQYRAPERGLETLVARPRALKERAPLSFSKMPRGTLKSWRGRRARARVEARPARL